MLCPAPCGPHPDAETAAMGQCCVCPPRGMGGQICGGSLRVSARLPAHRRLTCYKSPSPATGKGDTKGAEDDKAAVGLAQAQTTG